MCGDALEFPYRRFFRFVGFDMVEYLVVCDDLFSLIIADPFLKERSRTMSDEMQ